MTNGAQGKDMVETVNQTADLARLADASAKFMADQATAMTMLTAYGMSLTVQMAGAFMGAFANALEDKPAVGSSAAEPKTERAGTATVVPLRVVKKDRAPKADDLKKISGIGPRLEKVLNGMGVTTFAQIAKWDEAKMLRMDEKLGLENRIIRDNWASLAKALLEG